MMIAVENSFARSLVMNRAIKQMYFYKYFYYTNKSPYYFNFILTFHLENPGNYAGQFVFRITLLQNYDP